MDRSPRWTAYWRSWRQTAAGADRASPPRPCRTAAPVARCRRTGPAIRAPAVPVPPAPARPGARDGSRPERRTQQKHHDCRRLLAVDSWQLLGEVLTPQIDLLIGIVETTQSPRLQRAGDLFDVVPLRATERQRNIPPPLRGGTWTCGANGSGSDYRSSLTANSFKYSNP